MASNFSSNSETSSTSASAAITVSEFRARLAEMIGRAERGEEVLIARGQMPVAKLVPLGSPRKRRLGVLKDLMSEEAIEALTAALDEPLPSHEQAALEGGLTDSLGIARR